MTALLVAPVIVGVIGALVERYGLRRVHRYGHVAELLFTFGLAALIGELVQLIWGRVNVPYKIPEAMRATAFTLQGLDYSIYRVFMLLVSVAIFLALALLLTRTRVGLIIQAALTHPEMVGALGHNLDRIFMLTFGFGCGLAGLAGVIGGNVLGTEPAMAIQLGSIIFVVIVIGGLGSLNGALAASLIIGVLDNIANTFSIPFAPFFRLFGNHRGHGRHLERFGPYYRQQHRAGAALSASRRYADRAAARIVWETRRMSSLARRLGPWVLFATLMIALPRMLGSSFSLTVLNYVGVFIIFSCAYNMLLGQGGMLSFGHAVYFGMAGYFSIHLINYFHGHTDRAIPLVFVPLLGGLTGLILGILIGYVSTRRSGYDIRHDQSRFRRDGDCPHHGAAVVLQRRRWRSCRPGLYAAVNRAELRAARFRSII